MNLDKTSTTLKKINRLFEIINDIGEASSTEQDLLKAYVEDLYAAVTDGGKIAPQTKSPPKPAPTVSAAPMVIPPVQQHTPPAPKAAPAIAETPVAPPPPPAAPKVAPKAPVKPAVDPAMSELFELDAISELSDKLSSQPISDLTKAMGINEKILTVNELFGGDNVAFNNTMTKLNGLKSYDEAKTVLMKEAAQKYEWMKPSNHKKVKIFIKLVKRRYN